MWCKTKFCIALEKPRACAVWYWFQLGQMLLSKHQLGDTHFHVCECSYSSGIEPASQQRRVPIFHFYSGLAQTSQSACCCAHGLSVTATRKHHDLQPKSTFLLQESFQGSHHPSCYHKEMFRPPWLTLTMLHKEAVSTSSLSQRFALLGQLGPHGL